MDVTHLSADSLSDGCYRCGYDLRGITDDRPCPECGLLAQRSRRPTDELHNTHPRWLRSISLGALLILLSFVLALALPASGVQAADHILRLDWIDSTRLMYFCVGFPALLFAGGVLMLTRREGHAPADRASRFLRVTLRLAVLLSAFSLCVAGVQVELGIRSFLAGRFTVSLRLPDFVLIFSFILGLIGVISLPWLLFFRLRVLARRARIAELMEYSAIVGVGGTATLLSILALFVLDKNLSRLRMDEKWFYDSNAALWLEGAVATAVTFFGLWGAFLIVYFILTFRSARNKMRRQWSRDDRSIPSTAAPNVVD